MIHFPGCNINALSDINHWYLFSHLIIDFVPHLIFIDFSVSWMTENVELPMVKPGYKTPIILLCQFALIAAIGYLLTFVYKSIDVLIFSPNHSLCNITRYTVCKAGLYVRWSLIKVQILFKYSRHINRAFNRTFSYHSNGKSL